ncbi:MULTISPECIES: hypothetical protein [unclassified Paenibacillus]|uniref:hypothetical protein n=1 Tax=unclassified Paenibacillus TaxID=185978 RepID=UPI00362BA727
MIIQKPSFHVETLLGRVFIQDTLIDWEEYSIDRPAFDEADNFSIRAPWFVGGTNIMSSNGNQLTNLAADKDIPVRIELSGVTLLEGLMDSSEWAFDMNGESVTITGRGKIGRLIERSETRTIKNQTASSVAHSIFNYHGITAQITETSRQIGAYADESQTTNTDQNDWELLNWLAEWEGFVVRVSGSAGFFGPADQLPGQMLEPLSFTYGVDCEVRSIRREPSDSRDLIVEGRSYFNGRSIVEHYPRAPKVKTKATKTKKKDGFLFSDEEVLKEKFLFSDEKADKKKKTEEESETAKIVRRYLSGLSQEQLRQRVRSIYHELTKFGVVGELFIPKYTEIQTDRRISLFGVGQGLSLDYYCTKVSYNESKEGIITTVFISSKPREG